MGKSDCLLVKSGKTLYHYTYCNYLKSTLNFVKGFVLLDIKLVELDSAFVPRYKCLFLEGRHYLPDSTVLDRLECCLSSNQTNNTILVTHC